jgi:amidase
LSESPVGQLLDDHDATAMAALVRERHVHPRELVAAAIGRAERLNPTLNAFVHTQFERALADAELATIGRGAPPFAGVPFAFKDYQCREAGEAYRMGTRLLRDLRFIPTTTSPLALAFRAAGLIPIGRTNVPEFATVGTTEPVAFGPTHNPWDLDRMPAGSSGGSGAAVAAAIVPAAHGNDISGSIRLPAAACGLVGLKPTRGRVIVSTVDPPVGMFSDGVITRSVRDTAGLLDAITSGAGPWPAPPLPRSLTTEVGAPLGQMRVGVWTTAFNGADVDPGCADAAVASGRALENAGHRVSTAAPAELSDPELWGAMSSVLSANTASDVHTWATKLGRAIDEDDLEPVTWRIVQAGRQLSAVNMLDAMSTVQRLCRDAEQWWTQFDLLITPTSAAPAQPIGSYLADYRSGRGSAFTRPFNATGQPAMSIPFGWPDDGLPRGVQLIAAHGREDLLVRVASFLETAQPWWGHYDELAARLATVR